MAKKEKTRIISINISPGAFSSIFRRFVGEKSDYEFSGLAELRQILSNEKAKILYSIKYQKPKSIYHLSKLLKRNFKSVYKDIKLLEKFGFLELIEEKKANRKCLKPVLAIDSIQVNFQL